MQTITMHLLILGVVTAFAAALRVVQADDPPVAGPFPAQVRSDRFGICVGWLSAYFNESS